MCVALLLLASTCTYGGKETIVTNDNKGEKLDMFASYALLLGVGVSGIRLIF